MSKKITVLGGDTRQLHTAGYLLKKGYDITVFGFEHLDNPMNIRQAENLREALGTKFLLLPLPCTKNGKNLFAPFSENELLLKDITDNLQKDTLVLAGKASKQLKNSVYAAECNIYDYFNLEELSVKNALLTGEGILSILLERLPVTVFGLKAAITGYGRVAFFTARMLHSLGADITVFARSAEQLAKAETAGYRAEKLCCFAEKQRSFDCLINTVPAQVIGENELKHMHTDCLLVETASEPYGIDRDAAYRYGFTLIKAQGLPGKTAPVSAGKTIADSVDKLLKEVQN